MSSRTEVLIRILTLLQRKTLLEAKRRTLKCLKRHYSIRAINEKCCSVDGERGTCPLFKSPPRGFWQLKSPNPREFAIQDKKKNAHAQGQPERGGWAQLNWLMHLKLKYHLSQKFACSSIN